MAEIGIDLHRFPNATELAHAQYLQKAVLVRAILRDGFTVPETDVVDHLSTAGAVEIATVMPLGPNAVKVVVIQQLTVAGGHGVRSGGTCQLDNQQGKHLDHRLQVEVTRGMISCETGCYGACYLEGKASRLRILQA